MSPIYVPGKVVLAQNSATQPLLDLYPNPAAAYSLRQLYTGTEINVVRVRRSSDNTESDFTATQVSDGALVTFCGAGNGFVRTWYDQSGNGRNIEQTTTANQPQIVSFGSLVTQGSKAAMSFNGTSMSLRRIGDVGFRTGAAATVLTVTNIGSFDAERCLFDIGLYRALTYGNATAYNYYRTSKVTTITGKPSGRVNFNSYDNGSAVSISFNGALESIANPGFAPNPTGNTGIGATADGLSLFHNSTYQELVFYSTSLLASRTAIESNINAYYAIY
jgi:hypothetical protein